MALIVEDGTVVPGAESYCSVASADQYHVNFGNAAWALLDTPTKEAMLRRATAYMVQVYRLRWKGTRTGLAQRLDWPRFGVQIDDVGFGAIPAYVQANTVPVEIQNACASLALTANTEDLAPPIEREILSETVGPITTEYRAGAIQYKRYRAIDLMLKAFLDATGNQMVRA